jgi:hypothetical protein
MTNENESGFIPTGDADTDAATLGEIHGLHPSDTRATMLRWLTELSYGQDGPIDPAAVARRPGAADLHVMLRNLQAIAGKIADYADDQFAGVLPIACADMYGADQARDIAAMISKLATTTERLVPLVMNDELAEILFSPIVRDRWANGKAGRAADPVMLVRDSVAGRWGCSDELLRRVTWAIERSDVSDEDEA